MTRSPHIPFRDLLLLVMNGITVVLVLVIMDFMEAQAAKTTENVKNDPPGNIMVELRWPDGVAADVDLWVMGPDNYPVGFSNKSGPIFNLLRDDLGMSVDLGTLNYEMSVSRGLPEGDYAVGVHLYRNNSDLKAIPVTVTASKRKDAENSPMAFVKPVTDNLTRQGQEITMLRFRLDAEGELVPGSLNRAPKPLYGAR